jgi:hypothetical protein
MGGFKNPPIGGYTCTWKCANLWASFANNSIATKNKFKDFHMKKLLVLLLSLSVFAVGVAADVKLTNGGTQTFTAGSANFDPVGSSFWKIGSTNSGGTDVSLDAPGTGNLGKLLVLKVTAPSEQIRILAINTEVHLNDTEALVLGPDDVAMFIAVNGAKWMQISHTNINEP